MDTLRRSVARRGEAAGDATAAELRRFRAALDLLSDSVYIVSRRTMTIVDANEAACRNLGYRREELIGAEPGRVFTGSAVGRPELERIYDRLIHGPARAESVERTHRRKDGSEFPVEIQRTSVSVGGEHYIVAVARDISQRRAAEQALRDSEARFRALAESSPDAILLHSDWTIAFVNRAMCQLLGARDASELEGRPSTFMLDPGVAEAARRRIESLYAGQPQPRVEQLYRRLDGSTVEVEIAAAPLVLNGRPAAQVTVRDITERRRTESERAAIAQRNTALVEALGQIVYDWRPGEDRLVWEGHYTRVLGYPADEMGGATASWADRVHPDDLDAVKRHVEELTPQRPHYGLEYRFRHRDGSYRWMQDSGIGFFSQTGVLERIIGVFSDITQRKTEERLVQMEHAITRCLAEAESMSEGLQQALATLCEAQGWEAARLYTVDEAGELLRFQESWTISEAQYSDFNSASRLLTFARGVGLGGLAWESAQPIWVPDVSQDGRVANPALARTGIRSAFVFPVVSEGATIGIVATFSREVREPDERLLRTTRALGSQLGQFVERKRAQQRAEYLAQFDTLTELPNRTLFQDRLAQALNQARRHDWNVGVLLLDIDRFKGVNDTLGHAVGDVVLQDAAKRLAGCVRAGDTVARIGADEFAVIAADMAQPQDAGHVATKMVEALRAPFAAGDTELFLSGSVGIATYPLDGQDGVALVKNADAAMSRAKELGRNTYQFYAAAMNERALEKLLLQNELRKALERGEFRLHYQPKASLSRGHVLGFEALLRWQRPGHGLVPPGQFIPMLEETGLIVSVGDWVIRAACAQIRDWRAAGFRPLPVAVNIAAKQLVNHDIADVVEAALREHDVPAELLEIEITESDAMQSAERGVEMLRRLKAGGAGMAIDDFGTGYSSLSYLKRFPVDTLKLDRSFVKGLPDDADDASITLAVITMAHSLGLEVVAEGVETPEQRRFLVTHGCDVMQGYLLSAAVPAGQCGRFLTRA